MLALMLYSKEHNEAREFSAEPAQEQLAYSESELRAIELYAVTYRSAMHWCSKTAITWHITGKKHTEPILLPVVRHLPTAPADEHDHHYPSSCALLCSAVHVL
jgi:hypothetical protein